LSETLKQRLRTKAFEEGFSGFGVCKPDAVPDLGARLSAFIDRGFHGQMDWMAQRVGWRGDPAALWPEARSIIMLAEPYTPEHDPMERKIVTTMIW